MIFVVNGMKMRERVMSNYTPELIWDDFVEGCACCALNYGLEDDDE